MAFKKPKSENYCATIVEIKNTVELDNCDNIKSTYIFGNPVIISKETKVGDVGIFFPAETQLSPSFLHHNNLYRHSELNKEKEKRGYFEDSGRIKTVKFRGHQSCGFFIGTESLSFCGSIKCAVGDSFDEANGIEICKKYVAPHKQRTQSSTQGKQKRIKISKIIHGQFRFHQDTAQLGKNIQKLSEGDIVSCSYKLHGTSVIISKVLCNKKLSPFYKFLRWTGIEIVDKEYDNLFASRKVIKNDDINSNNSYYKTNIWGLANDRLKEFLLDGMTVYAEIVGFLPDGSYIQKGYDYGCAPNTFNIYIYRITYTNSSGDVFEFSAKQVQDWCIERGLNAVPELYYGRVIGILNTQGQVNTDLSFHDNLLNILKKQYLERDCFMCKNKVPAEGIVVRKECNIFEAYKLKSFRFLEHETKLLDKGEENIEDNQEESS